MSVQLIDELELDNIDPSAAPSASPVEAWYDAVDFLDRRIRSAATLHVVIATWSECRFKFTFGDAWNNRARF
jgi:hypothetical protein